MCPEHVSCKRGATRAKLFEPWVQLAYLGYFTPISNLSPYNIGKSKNYSSLNNRVMHDWTKIWSIERHNWAATGDVA